MIEINKLTRKRSKNVNFTSKGNDFFIKKRQIQNFEKTAVESGCYGNVKLNRQGLSTPNCSQINFKKSHQVLVALACLLKKL